MTRRRALTLLEVLLAVALVAALVAAMLGFLRDLLSTRRRAADHAARQRAATTLIDRVESDLMTCLVGDRAFGAGIAGGTDTLAILSRTVAVHLSQRGPDDPEVFADLQRVEYAFDATRERIGARRLAVGDPAGIDDAPFDDIGGPVHRLRFRYHDATMWRDSFDSLAENRLPVAVEVAVWFDPWPGRESGAVAGPAPPPERLTFDADAGFDEEAFARESDLDLFDEPRPDRIRVILIPDAAVEDPYAPSPGEEPQEP